MIKTWCFNVYVLRHAEVQQFLCVLSSADAEVELPPPSTQKLSSDLQPLMFWMSNATELLNFFQVKVEAMEKEWEFEGENDISNYSMFSQNKKHMHRCNLLF